VPTFNSAGTLALALGSLRAQRYDGPVQILCVDGGSTDATRELAARYDAQVLANPLQNEEEGRALGLEATDAELVLLLDADDELPHDGWLARLVAALDLAPDVVASDCLYHEWRRTDPPVTRLCALIGGTDPLAAELGFADRWATHLDRWTSMPVEEEDVGEALLVRIDPDRPPPLGSNGFLVRRAELLRTQYRPFVHSDVAGDLAANGWRFARVREGIVHHYAADLATYAHKARRRARRTVSGEPKQRRGFQAPLRRTAPLALSSLLLVGPALRALRGYRRRPDPAWGLYPLLHAITTLAYLRELASRRNPVFEVLIYKVGITRRHPG
jgi:glycosyltransferase involved in cell wall biosynthesis